jgi:hypothetical protein
MCDVFVGNTCVMTKNFSLHAFLLSTLEVPEPRDELHVYILGFIRARRIIRAFRV